MIYEYNKSIFTCINKIQNVCNWYIFTEQRSIYVVNIVNNNGCSILVKTPGKAATWLPVSRTFLTTSYVRWALNLSQTNSVGGLNKPIGRRCQTFSTQILVATSSIQPFWLQWITTPSGNVRLDGTFTLLKMIKGFSFVPSAITVNTTMYQFFSWPVDFIIIDFWPFLLTVFPGSISI